MEFKNVLDKRDFYTLLILISFVSVALFVFAASNSVNSFVHNANQINGLPELTCINKFSKSTKTKPLL